MPEAVVIENPVINSPFEEPQRHFRFDENGITNDIVPGRRESEYFIPIPAPRRKGGQLAFDTEWTQERIEKNITINRIRERVAAWRKGGYAGATSVTKRLLEHWQHPDRARRLFFCQIEALETAIYLTEIAHKAGDAWMENQLREANASANSSLFRVAFKMATGSGKTVVMAMLIAWQALNKLAAPQDARYADAFLIVTPGLTIRDRLQVLLPNDPHNYYRQMDIVPADLLQTLNQAKVLITNYHAFKLRERGDASKLTKEVLRQREGNNAFTESPGAMVRRVCKALGSKKNIIVVNDEAHHCYRRKVDEQTAGAAPAEEKLTGEERRNAEARVWINGLEAVKDKLGVKVVYDLSATPFFLRGSGYSRVTYDGKRITEGVLFPWVVSDFSLIDAIEAGIVKVPRVPVDSNANNGLQPLYRDLWPRIRDELPKSGRSLDAKGIAPQLPTELAGALHSLYDNYKTYFADWHNNPYALARGMMPPVFIVVCNNTSVSKMVYDFISGWEHALCGFRRRGNAHSSKVV